MPANGSRSTTAGMIAYWKEKDVDGNQVRRNQPAAACEARSSERMPSPTQEYIIADGDSDDPSSSTDPYNRQAFQGTRTSWSV